MADATPLPLLGARLDHVRGQRRAHDAPPLPGRGRARARRGAGSVVEA